VPAIDLNSDLGESFGAWTLGDDAAMLGVVTSANVACGFHAGDPSVMRTVCTEAVQRSVAIGAQVSYPDLVGFGRRFIDMAPDELRDAVLYQLGALADLLRETTWRLVPRGRSRAFARRGRRGGGRRVRPVAGHPRPA
jgi:UPF0271 protein